MISISDYEKFLNPQALPWLGEHMSVFDLFRQEYVRGKAYEVYTGICKKQEYRPLTQRRFCDMISFLDLYGLINARVVSMGLYGKTREIMSSLPEKVVSVFV